LFLHEVQASRPPSIPKVFSVVKLLKINVFPPLSKPVLKLFDSVPLKTR